MGLFILELVLVVLGSLIITQFFVFGLEITLIHYNKVHKFVKSKPKLLFLLTNSYKNYKANPKRKNWEEWENRKGQISKVSYWYCISSYIYYALFIIFEVIFYCIFHQGVFTTNLLFLLFFVPIIPLIPLGY